jgi:hypothetical protein
MLTLQPARDDRSEPESLKEHGKRAGLAKCALVSRTRDPACLSSIPQFLRFTLFGTVLGSNISRPVASPKDR